MKDNYVHLAVGELNPAQQRKFLKTGKIAFTAAQLKNSMHHLALHPANHKLLKKKAKAAGRGVNIEISPGEIAAGLAHHAGGGLSGASLWSWIKEKAYPWIKQNWGIIKPIASKLADVAVPAAATFLGAPQAAVPAREGIRALTGVGVPKKGSDAAKQRMAHLRSLRKGNMKAGSFIMS